MKVSGSGCFPLFKHTHRSSPPFPHPSDKKGLQHFLGILGISAECYQGWCRPPAAKRSRLLDSSAFYSKKLSAQKPDTPPSTVRCLQLTPLSANFSFMLEGKQSILFTDHKPLKFALFITSLPWSAMQQRRLSFQSEFLQVPPSPRSRQCCSWHPVRPELYRCIFLRNVPFQQSCLKVEFLCQLSTFLRLQS